MPRTAHCAASNQQPALHSPSSPIPLSPLHSHTTRKMGGGSPQHKLRSAPPPPEAHLSTAVSGQGTAAPVHTGLRMELPAPHRDLPTPPAPPQSCAPRSAATHRVALFNLNLYKLERIRQVLRHTFSMSNEPQYARGLPHRAPPSPLNLLPRAPSRIPPPGSVRGRAPLHPSHPGWAPCTVTHLHTYTHTPSHSHVLAMVSCCCEHCGGWGGASGDPDLIFLE